MSTVHWIIEAFVSQKLEEILLKAYV